MVVAALYGAGSGALHAVTGPDHLLSLGPLALSRPRAPWRIGLMWGIGHGLGTLALGIPALFAARFLHLAALAAWGERLAALALLATALVSARSLKGARVEAPVDARSPLAVGLVHGVTGAASLLLVLPVLVTATPLHGALFLAAFALGGALAMALLTELLAGVGSRLGARVVLRGRGLLVLAAIVLGVSWLVA